MKIKISNLFSLKLAAILFCLIFSYSTFAEIDFQFKSKSNFKNDISILPGILEGYVLENEPDVKLLVGYFPDKNFISAAKTSSEFDLKMGFMDQASAVDPINSQSDRKLVGFKRISNDGKIILQMKYTLKKNDQDWNEATTYILSNNSSAMASVQFPDTLSAESKIELLKGIDNVQVAYSQPKTVVKNIKEKFFHFIASSQTLKIFKKMDSLNSFVMDASFAAGSNETSGNCGQTNLTKSITYSTKKGSGLYDFSKIISAMEDETRKMSEQIQNNKNTDESKLNCLTNLYKDKKEKASQYWADQADEHNCLKDDNSVYTYKELNATPASKDKTACIETKNAMKYLANLESDFNKFLKGEDPAASLDCAKNHVNGEPELDNIAGVVSQAQKSFCCEARDLKSKDDTGGPLFHILEADYIKEHNIKGSLSGEQSNALAKECRDKKYAEKDKDGQSFVSANGFADCVENFMEGAKDLITSAIKAVTSLTEWETVKALGQLVMDLPGSAVNMVKMIGQEIAAKTYAATSCMSPYDSKKYVCKIVPEIASLLLGPGLVKKFAQAVVSKASKTALASVIAEAASQSTKLKKINSAGAAIAKGAGAAGNAAGKAVKAAAKTRYIKPSASVLKKVKTLLGKDISTPSKDWLLGKGKIAKTPGVAPGKTDIADQRVIISSADAQKMRIEAGISAETEAALKKGIDQPSSSTVAKTDPTKPENGIVQGDKGDLADQRIDRATLDKLQREEHALADQRVIISSADAQKMRIEAGISAETEAALKKGLDSPSPHTASVRSETLKGGIIKGDKGDIADQRIGSARVADKINYKIGDEIGVTRSGGEITPGKIVDEVRHPQTGETFFKVAVEKDGQTGFKLIPQKDMSTIASKPKAVQPEHVPDRANLQLTHNAETNRANAIAKTEQPDYVNSNGFERSAVQSGKEITVAGQRAEIASSKPFRGANGEQEIQIKVQTGIETRSGHVNQGKPTYEYKNVPLTEVAPGAAKAKIDPKVTASREAEMKAAFDETAAKKAAEEIQNAKNESTKLQISHNAETNRANAIAKTEQPDYVNSNGFERSAVQSGKEITVAGQRAEIASSKPFRGANGEQEIQIKVQTGIEIRPDHVNRGKPTYEYKNVSLGEVAPSEVASLNKISKELYQNFAKKSGKEISENKEALLKASSNLSDGQRVDAAKAILGKTEMNQDQMRAIQKAHVVGREHGYGTYTSSELREKAEVLKAADFKPDEIDKLMRSGITGKYDDYNTNAGLLKEAADDGKVASKLPSSPSGRGDLDFTAAPAVQAPGRIEKLYSTAAEKTGKEISANKEALLKISGNLSDAERVQAAGAVMGQPLGKVQAQAVMDAHNVGKDSGRGYGTYTHAELKEKMKILKSAGIEGEKADKIMRTGITGTTGQAVRPTDYINQSGNELVETHAANLRILNSNKIAAAQKRTEIMTKIGKTPTASEEMLQLSKTAPLEVLQKNQNFYKDTFKNLAPDEKVHISHEILSKTALTPGQQESLFIVTSAIEKGKISEGTIKSLLKRDFSDKEIDRLIATGILGP